MPEKQHTANKFEGARFQVWYFRSRWFALSDLGATTCGGKPSHLGTMIVGDEQTTCRQRTHIVTGEREEMASNKHPDTRIHTFNTPYEFETPYLGQRERIVVAFNAWLEDVATTSD